MKGTNLISENFLFAKAMTIITKHLPVKPFTAPRPDSPKAIEPEFPDYADPIFDLDEPARRLALQRIEFVVNVLLGCALVGLGIILARLCNL